MIQLTPLTRTRISTRCTSHLLLGLGYQQDTPHISYQDQDINKIIHFLLGMGYQQDTPHTSYLDQDINKIHLVTSHLLLGIGYEQDTPDTSYQDQDINKIHLTPHTRTRISTRYTSHPLHPLCRGSEWQFISCSNSSLLECQNGARDRMLKPRPGHVCLGCLNIGWMEITLDKSLHNINKIQYTSRPLQV